MILFFPLVFLFSFIYLAFYLRICFHRALSPKQKNPSVTVLIVFRNEASNLRKYLEKIIRQKYHCFELILIDDGSTDESYSLIEQFCQGHKHIHLYSNENKKRAGKREAILLGIQKANHEWILFTDADCEPQSNLWIEKMVNQIKNDQTEIVLGCSPVNYKKNASVLLASSENLMTAVSFVAAGLWRIPYMGLGRNMMVKKSVLRNHLHFYSDENSDSGDDDLLINRIATNKNTELCLDSDSIMWTNAPESFIAYYNQKIRHYQVSVFYKIKNKIFLLANQMLVPMHWIAFALIIFTKQYQFFFFFAFFYLIWALFLYYFKKKILSQIPLAFIILFHLLQPFYYAIFVFSFLIKIKYTWK